MQTGQQHYISSMNMQLNKNKSGSLLLTTDFITYFYVLIP